MSVTTFKGDPHSTLMPDIDRDSTVLITASEYNNNYARFVGDASITGSPGASDFSAQKMAQSIIGPFEDCLDSADCPLDDIIKKNLRFLIGSGTKLEPCPSLLNDGTFMQRGRDGEQDGSTVF